MMTYKNSMSLHQLNGGSDPGSGKLGEKDLKKIGHNLRKAWRLLKEDISDPALDMLDYTISELDKFEDIRYPERIARHYLGHFNGKPREELNHELVVPDIDDIAKLILEKSAFNPTDLTNRLNKDALEFLKRGNKAVIWKE